MAAPKTYQSKCEETIEYVTFSKCSIITLITCRLSYTYRSISRSHISIKFLKGCLSQDFLFVNRICHTCFNGKPDKKLVMVASLFNLLRSSIISSYLFFFRFRFLRISKRFSLKSIFLAGDRFLLVLLELDLGEIFPFFLLCRFL